jgi:dihydrofolate synthase/folylpolyglutamate synthase
VPDRLETYADFLEFLFARKAGGVKLGLENTRLMLERLGHPERSLRAFHVAGTNGKGSTAAMLAEIVRAAGYRTGLYTSPHLIDYRERIRVDGCSVAPEDLLRACERILPHLSEIPLTFFEITTILAILTFLDRDIDVAVMEVGLGGRLDATNVLEQPFPVITDIHFDHERILGRRLAKIASEKAGIIRGQCAVVTGVRRRALLDVFRERCREMGAPLVILKDEARWKILQTSWDGTHFRLETGENRYDDLFLPLPGDHQVANAALAVRSVEIMSRDLGLGIGAPHVSQGLERVSWPGRFQVLEGEPRIVLDAAHNPSGARSLARTLKRLCPDCSSVLVLGMLREKKHDRVVQDLAPLARTVIVTTPDSERAADPESLATAFVEKGHRPQVVAGVAAALRRGIEKAGPKGTVVVAGSCYTVGEALRALGIKDPFEGKTENERGKTKNGKRKTKR